MKKSFLGALAMMGIGLGLGAVQSTTYESQNNVRYDSRNQNKNQPVQAQDKTAMQIRNEVNRSYNTRYFTDNGIPPKIYGMYYVKRGTHKRTNI